MALMSYPNVPAIMYKGYGGFFLQEECESKKIEIENMIADVEIQRGNTVYIETYCMEMKVFENQLKENKKLNNTGLGV